MLGGQIGRGRTSLSQALRHCWPICCGLSGRRSARTQLADNRFHPGGVFFVKGMPGRWVLPCAQAPSGDPSTQHCLHFQNARSMVERESHEVLSGNNPLQQSVPDKTNTHLVQVSQAHSDPAIVIVAKCEGDSDTKLRKMKAISL